MSLYLTKKNATTNKVEKFKVAGNAGNASILYNNLGENIDGSITQKAITDELNLRPKAKDTVSTPVGIDPFANYYTKNEITSVSANVSLSNISPPLTRTSLTIGSRAGIKTTGIRFIVESWLSDDGLFGYIIWSDGYCEQWGKVVGGSNQVNTVSFLKSFKEIPQVYVSRIWRPGGDPGNTTADRRQICMSDIPTLSSFNIWTNGWESIDIFWKANGYINL